MVLSTVELIGDTTNEETNIVNWTNPASKPPDHAASIRTKKTIVALTP